VRSLRGAAKFEEANEALEHLLDLDPDNVRFWTFKADTLYRLLRYRESIATADHAIYLRPDYAPARRIREQALKRMYQRKRK
jgi:tetratricopeptide (TPR) repeat protein